MKAETKSTVTFAGKTYDMRYAYKRPDGTIMLVCETDELGGKFGDEVPAQLASAVRFTDGSELVRP